MNLENEHSSLEDEGETFVLPYFPILKEVSVISEHCNKVEYITASCDPLPASPELVSTSQQQPLTLLQVLKRRVIL